jgi:hypothetical protein
MTGCGWPVKTMALTYESPSSDTKALNKFTNLLVHCFPDPEHSSELRQLGSNKLKLLLVDSFKKLNAALERNQPPFAS